MKDDRFLIKPVKSAVAMLPDAKMEIPYEGAKEMLLVEDVDNRELLQELWMNALNPMVTCSKAEVTMTGKKASWWC